MKYLKTCLVLILITVSTASFAERIKDITQIKVISLYENIHYKSLFKRR